MPDVIIGRQPIFDRYLKVAGYELLYRPPQPGKRPGEEQAAMQGIVAAFAQIGLERLVGPQPAYLRLTRDFLTSGAPLPFAPRQAAVEVEEAVAPDPAVVQALTALRQKGYQIAVDQVTVPGRLVPLLRVAHTLKFDWPRVDKAQLPTWMNQLRPYGLKLLAQKVETPADLDYCRRLGFDLFQGYFLCQPNVQRGKKPDTSRLTLLRLLGQIQDPATDFRRLAQLVGQDPRLSDKLLRLANSAYYSRPRPITSIEQAVAIIGLNHLRSWLTMLHMAAVESKPPELMRIAMVRARLCERLARTLQLGQPDQFFLTGLLSVLGALLDLPIAEAAAALPLSQEVKDGLQERKGPFGRALNLAQAFEQGEWGPLTQLAVAPQALTETFVDAVAWADSLLQSTQDAPRLA